MNEPTFQGYVLQWLAEILRENPTLPFVLPEQERWPNKLRKPTDILLRDRKDSGRIAIVGELKLPDAPDGSAPDRRDVLQKTLEKANEFRAKWFFTWNVNDLMLWDNSRGAMPLYERRFDHFSLAPDFHIFDRLQLDDPAVLSRYKPFLNTFLTAFARYYMGDAEIALRPPDKQFAISLDVNLRPVIGALHRDLLDLCRDNRPMKATLQRYMAEALEWIPREEKYWSDELQRLARLCSYLLANKLIFYETLRKNFSALEPLRIDTSIRRGKQLAVLLDSYFEAARIASNDYEPVFHEVHFGKRALTTDALPFLGDRVVVPVRDLAERVIEFDLKRLDHEIVGRIYQEVNDPRERHRFGQHYTLPEIVDIINAFCINAPTDQVLDPSCGGGTFLVRAYRRKKFLAEKMGVEPPAHSQMLQQLFGVDIAPHAAHLATVNLATQELIHERNYPLIEHKDFFDLEPKSKLGHGWLPATVEVVATNPPYIKHELIGERTKRGITATLTRDARKWLLDTRITSPSGRSDIYVYFFLHSAAFISEGGYIGFITSNSWLSADFGVALQKFFLDNFSVVAILESTVERWFSDAAVITLVTILKRESDESRRRRNLTKFVRFLTPLEKIFPPVRDEASRLAAVDRLVEFIKTSERFVAAKDFRINPIRQAELLDAGLETDPNTGTEKFVGSMWATFLRAPDVFFTILERAGTRLVKLSQVATVRRGLKTGANGFFYLRDITNELSDPLLKEGFGISRKDTKAIRVVEDGNGTPHLIEAEFLKQVLASPKEIDQLFSKPRTLPQRLLVVHKDKKDLHGTHVLNYIKIGETRRFGGSERGSIPAKNPSCRNRERWYDVGDWSPATILVPETANDKPFAFLNLAGVLADQRLIEILCDDPEVIAAPLMSSFGVLVAELYGRISLGEGGLDLPASNVAKFLTFSPAVLQAKDCNKLKKAVTRVAERVPLSFFEEALLADRHNLDEAVLEVAGFTDPIERRTVREQLVTAVNDLMTSRLGRASQIAGEPGKAAKGRKQVNVAAVASELWADFDTSMLRKFPFDFVSRSNAAEIERIEFDNGEVEIGTGLYGAGDVRIGSKNYSLKAISRAEFAKYTIEVSGLRTIEIPLDPNVCLKAVKDYEDYLALLRRSFRSLAQTRTSDPKLIAKLESQLLQLADLKQRVD